MIKVVSHLYFPKKIVVLLVVSSVFLLLGWFGYLFVDSFLGHDIPLYTASQEGDWAQVQRLLAQGANPNETTDLQNDRTALFWAAYQGRVDMVNLLIQRGINVNIVDTHGQTALDYAGNNRSGSQSAVIQLLRQSGAKHGSELQ